MALVAERYEHCRSEIGRTQTAVTLLIDRDGKDVLSLNYLCQISDSAQSLSECYDEKSLTYDLAERDRLPDVQTLRSSKMSARWGPHAFKYSAVVVPEGCDPIKWKRLRVIAVAKRFIGLPLQASPRSKLGIWQWRRSRPGLFQFHILGLQLRTRHKFHI